MQEYLEDKIKEYIQYDIDALFNEKNSNL